MMDPHNLPHLRLSFNINCAPYIMSVGKIGSLFGTPFDTTAKVMQIMNNANILNSQKGINGGYNLAKSLKDITYLEIASLIEGKNIDSVCLTSKGTYCELYEKCNITSPIDLLNRKLNQFFNDLNLHDLLLDTDSQITNHNEAPL